MRNEAIRLCQEYLVGWKNTAPENIKVKKLTGGLSNHIFTIALPDGTAEPNEVLLRIYGQASDKLTESIVFTILSERHQALPGISGRLKEHGSRKHQS
jgi:hypothetical protein